MSGCHLLYVRMFGKSSCEHSMPLNVPLQGKEVKRQRHGFPLFCPCRVSDTLAGACLGVFLTGAAANLGRALRSKRRSKK